MYHENEPAVGQADRPDTLPTTLGWLAEESQALGKFVDALTSRLEPVLRPADPRALDGTRNVPEHMAPLQQQVVSLIDHLRDLTAHVRDLNERVAL